MPMFKFYNLCLKIINSFNFTINSIMILISMADSCFGYRIRYSIHILCICTKYCCILPSLKSSWGLYILHTKRRWKVEKLPTLNFKNIEKSWGKKKPGLVSIFVTQKTPVQNIERGFLKTLINLFSNQHFVDLSYLD